MIHNLPLNPINRQLVADFKLYLKVRGYKGITKMLSGVKELLHRMEAEGKSIKQIEGEEVKAHYEHLLNRPKYQGGGGKGGGALSLYTVNGYLYGLRLFFDYLEKVELLKVNPMSGLSFKLELKSERTVLTKTEIKRLYASCENEQERAILGLFYGCGLRRNEAEKLNLKDVDFRGNWLYVRSGKGKKRRVIPLTESLVEDFKNYVYNQRITQQSRYTKAGDKKAFMLNKSGSRMRGNSYWKYFKALLKRSEIKKKVSLHHLRHSIATHLLEGGMSIEEVRDYLGHEFLESTQLYTRVDENQLKL